MGSSYCQVTPANPADLPKVVAALTGLDGIDIDSDTGSVSVFAPGGVATLSEVFRRVDALGVDSSIFPCATLAGRGFPTLD